MVRDREGEAEAESRKGSESRRPFASTAVTRPRHGGRYPGRAICLRQWVAQPFPGRAGSVAAGSSHLPRGRPSAARGPRSFRTASLNPLIYDGEWMTGLRRGAKCHAQAPAPAGLKRGRGSRSNAVAVIAPWEETAGTCSLKQISERERPVRFEKEASQVGRRDEACPQALQVCLGDPTASAHPFQT